MAAIHMNHPCRQQWHLANISTKDPRALRVEGEEGGGPVARVPLHQPHRPAKDTVSNSGPVEPGVGVGVGDFIKVLQLATQARKRCMDAPSPCNGISNE